MFDTKEEWIFIFVEVKQVESPNFQNFIFSIEKYIYISKTTQ